MTLKGKQIRITTRCHLIIFSTCILELGLLGVWLGTDNINGFSVVAFFNRTDSNSSENLVVIHIRSDYFEFTGVDTEIPLLALGPFLSSVKEDKYEEPKRAIKL